VNVKVRQAKVIFMLLQTPLKDTTNAISKGCNNWLPGGVMEVGPGGEQKERIGCEESQEGVDFGSRGLSG